MFGAVDVPYPAASEDDEHWDLVSDERLKDTLSVFKPGIKELLQLKPVNFRYKKDNPVGSDSEVDHVGFLAQNVVTSFPESEKMFKSGFIGYDPKYIECALVNAVQQLAKKVTKLSNKIK